MLQVALPKSTAPVELDQDQPTFRLRPSIESPVASARLTVEELDPQAVTARAYRDYYRDGSSDQDVIESWCRVVYGSREHAHLLRELHKWNPEAADRVARALIAMPAIGSDFFDFQLDALLGNGAFARVYLARQGEKLANRHVVVKVTADCSGEAHALAQLHHPNIVPVYSVHHCDPFQIVCMPYQGCTTLHDVLGHVNGLDHLPRSGETFVNALKPPPVDTALAPVVDGPLDSSARTTLANLPYVEAVVWLAMQLADGLAYAHEHGIVHQDLKPANILLSDDGRPMLLDFNAAKDTKRPQEATAWVAGTLPYMAPEQIATFHGDAAAVVVDARSDLFALGVILYELLTGRYPFKHRYVSFGAEFDQLMADRRCAPPRLRNWNPDVSPALEAIVRRCLEPDVSRRYQSARELFEDLQRQHDHRPLLHQREPSHIERMRKWTRRHPRLLWIGMISLFSTILLSAFAAVALSRGQQLELFQSLELERTEQERQQIQAQARWKQFREDLKTVQFILYTRLNEPEQRADGIKRGILLLESFDVIHNPEWQDAPLVKALPAEDRQQLAESMGELLLLLARGLRLQHSDEPTSIRDTVILDRSLHLNERAEACSRQAADSPGLWNQRAATNDALGRIAAARECRVRAASLPVRSAADSYWLASNHVARGRVSEAMTILQDATNREPQSFWAWFVLGDCYDRLGNDAEAKACFSVCVALKPDFEWAYFNRGLAQLRKQEYRGACMDFDAVLKKRPDLVDAYLNRALARQGLKEFREAELDLTSALDRGGPSRLYFVRGRVRDQLGDKEGSQRDFEAGVKSSPTDEKSWISRGFYVAARDPKAALADFEQALRVNPRSLDALQNKAYVLAEKLGKNQQALEALDRALALYPDSVKARSGRGILYARLGQREPALRDAEESLRRDSGPPRLYQVACIYALTSKDEPTDRTQAIQLLSSSLRQGYGFNLLESDDDLKNLRALPEFLRMVEAAKTLRPAVVAPSKKS